MLISFIIPAFNAAPYLERCLDSIFALPSIRSCRCEYEVICVDDGSTDATPSILRHYEELHPGIVQVISQTNQGLSASRNAAMDRARGQYLYFVDADDSLAPEADLPVDLLASLTYDIVGIEIVCQDIAGQCRPYNHQRHPHHRHYDRGSDYLRSHNVISCVVGYFWRRSYLEEKQMRFLPGIYHEDELFTTLAFAQAGPFIYLPTPLYIYHDNESGITRNQDPEKRRKRIADHRLVIRLLKEAADASPEMASALRLKRLMLNIDLWRKQLGI